MHHECANGVDADARASDNLRMPTARALAWATFVADGVVSIAVLWSWAFRDAAFRRIDVVALAALVLGFISAAATLLVSLRTERPVEAEFDALALFPTEEAEPSRPEAVVQFQRSARG